MTPEPMARFYFDLRDGDEFAPDEEGVELPGIREAREEASRTLGAMSKDAMPDGQHRNMAIEVRSSDKRPLLKVAITFEVEPLAEDPQSALP